MRMSSINQVTLLGNLGADAEVKEFSNGDKYAKFSMATSEKWKDKNSGEQRERTQWHNIVVYIPQLAPYLETMLKGDKVLVQGQMETRTWDDKDGNKRYMTEVCVRPFVGKLVRLTYRADGAQPAKSKAEPDPFASGDDSIPF